MSTHAEEQFEQHFFKRLGKFRQVRRFIAAWVLLLILLCVGLVVQTLALSDQYQKLAPAAGGTYSEGIVGAFTDANPLFAVSPADTAVARLVFASLLKYDQRNELVGDLAESWTVDANGTLYTVHLRPNVQWQDGTPLTAEDVAYTYSIIQNPDAQSPLRSAWKGVTVTVTDARTVTFKLPSNLTAFPYSLTNGIVPKHLLANSDVKDLRSLRFNTVNPVGAGPFRLRSVGVTGDKPDEREEQIGLVANTTYYAGRPQLDALVIHTFRSEDRMLASFKRGELSSMAGLDSLPDTIEKQGGVHDYSIPLTSIMMTFFNNSQPILSDARVRRALVQAVDVPAIVRGLSYPAIIARSPLLPGQVGYDKGITQLGLDVNAANEQLDKAGWTGRNEAGIRTKDGKLLNFTLIAQSNSEYAYVTNALQSAWRAIGVDATVQLQNASELQSTVTSHGYDALLYGISIGKDPDVYAYWDSSQASASLSSRYNLSEYKSKQADRALEAGRTRSDPTLRAAKYKPFLEAWRNDAPALALYQPRFLYVTNGPLYNFAPRSLNAPVDRYSNVLGWQIREEKTAK